MRDSYSIQEEEEPAHIAFKVREGIKIQVMFHISVIDQADITATHDDMVIYYQVEVIHKIACIYDSLAD